MISKRFLYHFAVPCYRVETLWTAKGTVLEEIHRLPDFSSLEETSLPSSQGNMDLRMGWNEKGLAFSLRVEGRKRLPWCRVTRPDESDGIQLCIDTRDVRNVHRASRFCHRLVFLPGGNGSDFMRPSILWFPINRAKAHPNPIDVNRIKIGCQIASNAYRLDFAIPTDSLTGYEPLEYSRIGFHYYLVDKDLGNRAFLNDVPFPHGEDPSLWASMDLVESEK